MIKKYRIKFQHRVLGFDKFFGERFLIRLGDYYYYSTGWNVLYAKHYRYEKEYKLVSEEHYSSKPDHNTPAMWMNSMLRHSFDNFPDCGYIG